MSWAASMKCGAGDDPLLARVLCGKDDEPFEMMIIKHGEREREES